jgi:hypothetical protein
MRTPYINRLIQTELDRLKHLFPVVVVTGPRQSGKTTLCKKCFNSYHYVNLEDVTLREQILSAPKPFLKQYSDGLIIDEAQNLPELFSFLQVIVDEVPGCKYVLTGSSNLSLMEKVTQSLAGRAATLTLLPFSLKELEGISGSETDNLLLKGGFPAVWAKKVPVTDLSRNYYNTYIERDVRQLLNIKNLIKFQTFIRLCAGRAGTELNASILSDQTGVSVHTITDWLSVLEASYIIFRLQPFYRNVGKRLIKSPKLYFYDTGLLCFLLGIVNEKQLSAHPLRGAIFENLVVLEFLKHRLNLGKNPDFYFYRDKSQNEVDILIQDGEYLHAFEIKSAKSFHREFLKNLNYIRKVFGREIASTMLIYDGETDIITPENGMVNFRNLNLMQKQFARPVFGSGLETLL